jgi:molybdopterin-binding protein
MGEEKRFMEVSVRNVFWKAVTQVKKGAVSMKTAPGFMGGVRLHLSLPTGLLTNSASRK